MTPQTWLTLAADATLRLRISDDPVLPLYGPLMRQFEAWQPITWDSAVVGLHIVYGWMPTIPDLGRPADLNAAEQQAVVTLLNAARQRLLSVAEMELLKQRLINNSTVGLSKLLHFLAPERYVIWDSRVAKAWYGQDRVYPYRYEPPAEYLAYLGAITAWLANPDVTEQIAELRTLSPDLATVSPLRMIELVLFHN